MTTEKVVEETADEVREELVERKESDGELELPDLSIGLVIGMKQDGHFFMQEITPVSDVPMKDKMVINTLLSLAQEVISGYIYDQLGIGLNPRVAKNMQTSALLAKGMAAIAQKMDSQAETNASLAAGTQHIQAELMQYLRPTPSITTTVSPDPKEEKETKQ